MSRGESVDSLINFDSRLSNLTGVSRPVTSLYGIEIGSRIACSRYLAPVSYCGVNFGIGGRWSKALPFAPHRALMVFEGDLSASPEMLNESKRASMMGVNMNSCWDMMAFWRLPHNLTVSIGGGPGINAGILALLKNSNNPVSINLAASLNASAGLSWRKNLGRLPVVASLNFRTPLLSAFFMPGYGETFYEIYLGNRAGIIHCGWPGNRQRYDMNLGIIADFGRTAMQIGYSLIFDRESANNLIERSLTNSFTIYVIPGGIGLRNRRIENRPGIN